MARASSVSSLVLWAVVAGGIPVASARGDLDPQEVSGAIDRAVAYLKRTQAPNGLWREYPGYPAGTTAVCTLALLTAGLGPEDDAVARGLAVLARAPSARTYVRSLETLVFCEAAPERYAQQIVGSCRGLQIDQIQMGAMRGGWSYPGGPGDHSNSQFAMLALYEAARVGAPVRPEVWLTAWEHWRRTQNPDGSWGYRPGDAGTGTMTTAGITSLVMAESQIDDGDARIEDGRIECCGRQRREPAIDRGLDWMARNFSVTQNPGAPSAGKLLYYLYGLERVGRMTARRFIGDHDWYREGTEQLLRLQDKLTGAWHSEVFDELSTSFALLFLAKGRRPILLAKLEHTGDDWNHHRQDAFNLTSHVEKQWKRDLTWEIIDVSDADVDDLSQSPVLYLNGSDAPQFSDDEVKELRTYIDQGGFLFAVASCGGQNFDSGFRQLMKRVFPEPGYELKLLPAEHPVWHAEVPVPADQIHPLYGINSGCRTSVIYCPDDLSCLWELARPGREARLDQRARPQVLGGVAIGINVLAYATNREVKFKYEIPAVVNGSQQQDPFQRAKLYIAKLKHAGDWDSAPRALVNAEEALQRETGLRVSTDRRDVAIADDKIFEYPIVFMDGRQSFHFSDEEREHLRMLVKRGGMLVADSLCASKAFGDAFRQEMEKTFAPRKLEPIPLDHPIFTARYGGFDIRRVQFRDPSRGGAGAPLAAKIREIAPRLEGIKIDDEYGVIFSPYDLSCALERQEGMDCEGYVREDAARIAINIVLYGLNE